MLYNLVRGPQVCQLFSCYVSPSINKVLIIIIIINTFKVSIDATEHGCRHDNTAIRAYGEIMKGKHETLKLKSMVHLLINNTPGFMQLQTFYAVVTAVVKAVGR